MTNSFFHNGVPQSMTSASEFFEKYEKASPADLLALQDEIEFMSSEEICQIDRFLLANPRADGQLTTIICSGLPKIHDLDYEALGYLMLESYKNYAADKYDQATFEKNMVKLVDGYWPDRPRTILGYVHGSINSGNLADASGVKKAMILSMGSELDYSIACQLRRSLEIDERYTLQVGNLAGSLAAAVMPQSLQALLDVMISNGEILLASDLFQRLVKEDALYCDYIDTFSSKLGHDFVLRSIKDTPFYKSPSSANNISDKYGESALFDADEEATFDRMIHSSSAPGLLELVFNEKLDKSKFPSLIKYMADNLNGLYRCVMSDKSRLSLRRFGIASDRSSEVLDSEVYMLTKSLKNNSGMDLTSFNSAFIADRVSREYHNPNGQYVEIEYLWMIELVKEIGLEKSHDVLKAVDGRFISDVMSEVIDSEDIHARRRLMKLYPQAKGSVLESDLGL